jgi:hypothetical protein
MADRPFVDGPPGPADAVWSAARAAAEHWDLAAPVLVRLGMNGIFATDGVLLRVGRVTGAASAAVDLAGVLASAGVRVPAPVRADAVVAGDLTVTAWELLDIVDAEPDWRDVGRMVAIVHGLARDDIPAGYPVPAGEGFAWWRFDDLLVDVGDLLDDPARRGLVGAVERHAGWADGVARVVCHGDVHPGNVAMTADGPVLLDWDLVCSAPPGWDHAMLVRIARWGLPTRWYDEFAAGYGRSLADDPVTMAVGELRLVAATLMRLRAGRDDPAAMPEAQRRLAYWRGDLDAPTWTAV